MRQAARKVVSRVARYAAQEFADELARREQQASESTTASSGTVRIDVEHLVRELGSGGMNQRLIHLFTWNHRWIALLAERNRRAAVATYDFIDSEMPQALFTLSQMQVIEARSNDMLELDGQVLDLGVYKGGSTRSLARIFPDRQIHGFDSFEGLPEDWAHVQRGDFGDIAGQLPDMPSNVTLYKGWFDETLPVWVKEHDDAPISVLRVDCDIYSSTRTIFEILGPLIRPGTWIVFDELIGYKGWEQHEYRAFMEFIEMTGYGYEFVAYGLTYSIVRLTP